MSTMNQAYGLRASETERALTLGVGGLLSLVAVRRAPWALGMAALGAALIYRGATGRWPGSGPEVPLGTEAPAEAEAPLRPREQQVDETVEGSFPASDPPGWHTGSSFTQVSE